MAVTSIRHSYEPKFDALAVGISGNFTRDGAFVGDGLGVFVSLTPSWFAIWLDSDYYGFVPKCRENIFRGFNTEQVNSDGIQRHFSIYLYGQDLD